MTIGAARRTFAALVLVLGVASASYAQGHSAPEHDAKAAPTHGSAKAAPTHGSGKDAHGAPAAKPEADAKKPEQARVTEEPVKVVKSARASSSLASLPDDVEQIRKRMAAALGGAAPARSRVSAPAAHGAAGTAAPGPSHAAPAAATSVAAPVRLVWKPAVVWPSELRPAADATGRIVLVWRLPASEVAAGTR